MVDSGVEAAAILVVEDDELSRIYATMALERLGYHVIAEATRRGPRDLSPDRRGV